MSETSAGCACDRHRGQCLWPGSANCRKVMEIDMAGGSLPDTRRRQTESPAGESRLGSLPATLIIAAASFTAGWMCGIAFVFWAERLP